MLKEFLQLSKIRPSLLATFAVASGFVAAAESVILDLKFLLMVIASFLIGGGANAFNQAIEFRYDALMKRTSNRLIPSGRLSVRSAYVYGIVSGLLGSGLMWLVGKEAFIVSILLLITYTLFYTPLKQINYLNLYVGSVSGALPPIIGWCAAQGPLSKSACILFLHLFSWQIPHFAAIAWRYREDYRNAGFKMPFTSEKFSGSERYSSIIFSVAYLSLTVLLGFYSLSSGWLWILGIVSAALFVIAGIMMVFRPGVRTAKWTISMSIISLTFVYVGFWIHGMQQ